MFFPYHLNLLSHKMVMRSKIVKEKRPNVGWQSMMLYLSHSQLPTWVTIFIQIIPCVNKSPKSLSSILSLSVNQILIQPFMKRLLCLKRLMVWRPRKFVFGMGKTMTSGLIDGPLISLFELVQMHSMLTGANWTSPMRRVGNASSWMHGSLTIFWPQRTSLSSAKLAALAGKLKMRPSMSSKHRATISNTTLVMGISISPPPSFPLTF